MINEKYRVYYTSKSDMFIITKDDGTLKGKYDTDLYCKNETMAKNVCNLLNHEDGEKMVDENYETIDNELILNLNDLPEDNELKHFKEVLSSFTEVMEEQNYSDLKILTDDYIISIVKKEEGMLNDE